MGVKALKYPVHMEVIMAIHYHAHWQSMPIIICGWGPITTKSIIISTVSPEISKKLLMFRGTHLMVR